MNTVLAVLGLLCPFLVIGAFFMGRRFPSLETREKIAETVLRDQMDGDYGSGRTWKCVGVNNVSSPFGGTLRAVTLESGEDRVRICSCNPEIGLNKTVQFRLRRENEGSGVYFNSVDKAMRPFPVN
jgi:hypothetical protein